MENKFLSMFSRFDKLDNLFAKYDSHQLYAFSMALTLLTIVYSLDKFNLSPFLDNCLNNDLARLLVFGLVGFSYSGRISFGVFFAIVMTLIFKLVNVLATQKDGFALVKPELNIHPGCSDMKVQDLMNYFNGDQQALLVAMNNASCPYNIVLTDENAPIIATYLINNNHNISQKCMLQ